MDKEYTPAEAKAWLAGYDAGRAFAKKAWVGLTDDEIERIYAASRDVNYEYERAIEAKLKEKNCE